MTKKSPSEAEILAQIDGSLAEDVLAEWYADSDVTAALRATGGDPETIGRRGSVLAAELFEQRRLAWQANAKKKIKNTQPLWTSRADYSGLAKDELLGLLHTAKNNPRLSQPVTQLFHKRKPEDVSEEELRELLAEVDALAILDQDDGNK